MSQTGPAANTAAPFQTPTPVRPSGHYNLPDSWQTAPVAPHSPKPADATAAPPSAVKDDSPKIKITAAYFPKWDRGTKSLPNHVHFIHRIAGLVYAYDLAQRDFLQSSTEMPGLGTRTNSQPWAPSRIGLEPTDGDKSSSTACDSVGYSAKCSSPRLFPMKMRRKTKLQQSCTFDFEGGSDNVLAGAQGRRIQARPQAPTPNTLDNRQTRELYQQTRFRRHVRACSQSRDKLTEIRSAASMPLSGKFPGAP